MSSGPRSYTAGTERALFRLASGTCYFLNCTVPVISYHEAHPIVGVEIAHIRGAKPGSARYSATMSDLERASFSNLILLCTTHHKLVDRIDPDRYPAETLVDWKTRNEVGDDRSALPDVDDRNLERLLEQFVATRPSVRLVEVDLSIAVDFGVQGHGVMPLEQFDAFLRHNPHLAERPQDLVASVKNVGGGCGLR